MENKQKILLCDTTYMDSQLTGSLRRFRPSQADTIRIILDDIKSSH